MAHMREEKIAQQPSLLRPPPGAALREYQVRAGAGGGYDFPRGAQP